MVSSEATLQSGRELQRQGSALSCYSLCRGFLNSPGAFDNALRNVAVLPADVVGAIAAAHVSEAGGRWHRSKRRRRGCRGASQGSGYNGSVYPTVPAWIGAMPRWCTATAGIGMA